MHHGSQLRLRVQEEVIDFADADPIQIWNQAKLKGWVGRGFDYDYLDSTQDVARNAKDVGWAVSARAEQGDGLAREVAAQFDVKGPVDTEKREGGSN